MRWTILLLSALFIGQSQAQSVKLPDKMAVQLSRLTDSVRVEWDGDASEVITGSSNLVAFREQSDDPKVILLRIIGYAKGSYKLTVVVGKTVGGKTVLSKAVCTVEVDGGAPPAPEPGPTPPEPPPPSPPSPTPNVVDPSDPDYPTEVEASFQGTLKEVVKKWTKAETLKLAKAHVTLAKTLTGNVDLRVGTVHGLMKKAMEQTELDIPDSIAVVLGSELNKVLPRGEEVMLTKEQVKLIRRKMILFAVALQNTTK